MLNSIRISCRVPVLVVSAGILCVAGACTSDVYGDIPVDLRERLYPQGPAPILTHADDSGAFTLQRIRIWGDSLEGPQAFTYISSMAVSASGVMAVGDRHTCSVLLFDVSTTKRIGSIGRCGNGPGEFRSVSSIAFAGDTIFVWDGTRRQVFVFALDGTAVREFPIEDANGDVLAVRNLLHLGDSTLVASAQLRPATSAATVPRADSTVEPKPLIAILHARTGRTREWFMKDSPFALANKSNLARSVPICAPASNPGRRIALLNSWVFNGVILDASREMRVSRQFLTSLPSQSPTERAPGDWSAPWRSALACADSAVLFQYARSDSSQTGFLEAHVEVRDYDGKLLARIDRGSSDTTFLATPAAGYKSDFFFSSNTRMGYPTIHQVRLVRRDSAR